MSITKLDDVYNFEGNIESCAEDFLTPVVGDIVVSTLDIDTLVLPRVSVAFESSGALDPADLAHEGTSTLEYRKYTGNLEIQVATDVSLDSDTNDSVSPFENHKELRGQVRKSMRISQDNWTTLSLDSVRITSAGDDAANGYYTRDDSDVGGKPAYTNQTNGATGARILFSSGEWIILGDSSTLYTADEAEASDYPWQVPLWDGSTLPAPSVEQWRSLVYYDVKYCRPTGTSFEVDGDLAVSTLTYEIQFSIRDDVKNLSQDV